MEEFRSILQAFSDAGIRFLIVGGYATIAHGHTRATDDLDIWIDPTTENAERTYQVLQQFGANVEQLTVADLADPYSFFRIGDQRGRRIDIMGASEGLHFSRCWQNRYKTDFLGIEVPFLGLMDLIRNKKRIGRHVDLADVESLQALHRLSDEDM
jgi:hypothetical protein